MTQERWTEGGTRRSLADGSRDCASGRGLRLSPLTIDAWRVVESLGGIASGGDTEIERRESGLTRLGEVLLGFAFVSGTIAADGTFMPSSVMLGDRFGETLGNAGLTYTGLPVSRVFGVVRRSCTSRSTD